MFFFFFFSEIRISRQIFLKVSNIHFQENPSSGSSAYKRGETRADRHGEGNRGFSLFMRMRLKIIKVIIVVVNLVTDKNL
jgi:hypothetical protein